jgi:hypothetical protein
MVAKVDLNDLIAFRGQLDQWVAEVGQAGPDTEDVANAVVHQPFFELAPAVFGREAAQRRRAAQLQVRVDHCLAEADRLQGEGEGLTSVVLHFSLNLVLKMFCLKVS